MKKNMTFEERFIEGFALYAVDSETGEVVSIELPNGEKLTREYVLIILKTVCGWSPGHILLFKEHEDFVSIMNENHTNLADIGKKVADSFRRVRYVKYIN